ncbi:glycosyltransferase family 2 protein [Mucilaginibacter sp. OK098]|uniref:glycosyltransferase family 2 protein n=1 Tax=Mucilaginibacter sp. OK098 TaxID=1855297 RepID=UPI00091006D7|nr:glycosyltransferase family 2 protein [Mucilaginibacter sp. OK098]SHN24208.1 Glycosyltransferase involved in cell wall bisynthesis [Mucilaginibacter sp. OK098]
MNDPLVSIIMPAYNAEKFIEESINSVINQTFNNWELLIINDGSTDSTESIACKYAATDARVKLINQENKRLGAARNTGILNAKGSWIAFLDADDLWMPDKLKKQLSVAKTEPKAGVIFTDGFTFYDNSIKTALPYGTVTGFFTASAIYKLEYQGNYIPVLSALIKKAHIDNIGLQDESPYVYGCEDWDYWLRLAINGVSFFGMEEKLFYYRRHISNMSNDSNLMALAKATVFIKNFKKELLSNQEIRKINGFINLTICGFIKLGRIKEALFLNNGMYNVSKKAFRKLSSLFISILGSRSYYLTRMVFKVNSF